LKEKNCSQIHCEDVGESENPHLFFSIEEGEDDSIESSQVSCHVAKEIESQAHNEELQAVTIQTRSRSSIKLHHFKVIVLLCPI